MLSRRCGYYASIVAAVLLLRESEREEAKLADEEAHPTAPEAADSGTPEPIDSSLEEKSKENLD